MTYYISAILLTLNSIVAFGKKNKKIIAYLLIIFAWLLFWGSTVNPDYKNYLRNYSLIGSGMENFSWSSGEIGFMLLMKISATLGLKYEIFLAIISAIGFLLILSTVKKFTDNYNYFYFLYFLFPFFLDVVQVKNFLSMSILIFAVRYLVESTPRGKIKFLICILFASSIHIIAVAYLPMLLSANRKRRIVPYYIALIAVISSIYFLLLDKQIPFISELVEIFIKKESTLMWFDTKTNWGFLLSRFLQGISFLMAFLSRHLIINKTKYQSTQFKITRVVADTRQKNFLEKRIFGDVIFSINLLAFVYLPLFLLASPFNRLIRNIVPLNYISFAIANQFLNKREKLHFNILVVLYIIAFFMINLWQFRFTIIDNVLRFNIFKY